MKFWDKFKSWQEAEAAWDAEAQKAQKSHPLKLYKHQPNTPAIAPKTARFLKWKGLSYLFFHKRAKKILLSLLKHPFRYGIGYLRALRKNNSIRQEGDLFYYDLSSEEEFLKRASKENALLLVGFSFCQKPLECPSGRFNAQCLRSADHPVCRQCPIGKMCHALPQGKTEAILIPTVHDIGEKLFEMIKLHPKKKLVFLITACSLSLKMFGDLGNMVGVPGIGVELKGRVCNTMKAFKLAERGIKPAVTVVTPETEERLLALIRRLRNSDCGKLGG